MGWRHDQAERRERRFDTEVDGLEPPSPPTGDARPNPSRAVPPDARSDVLGQAMHRVHDLRTSGPSQRAREQPRPAVLRVHDVDVPDLGPQSDRSDEITLVVDGDHVDSGAGRLEPSRKRLGPNDDGDVRSRRHDEGHESFEMCDRPSPSRR